MILVIGDLILDKWNYVSVDKISAEAPVLIFSLEEKATTTFGGAGLVATFLKEKINTDVCFFSNIPNPEKVLLTMKGIKTYSAVVKKENIIIKERFIEKKSKYLLTRIDNDKLMKPVTFDLELIDSIIEENKISCTIMSDYDKGFFSNEKECEKLINILKTNNIPIFLDTKTKNIMKFSGVNFLKLNTEEINKAMTLYNCSNAQDLVKKINCDFIIETKGEKGASIYNSKKHLFSSCFKKENVHPPNVIGCGDVFDCTFCFNYFEKKKSLFDSISKGVKIATLYAYRESF